MFGPFGEAAILGIVQGLTEFLPISSDGHLALAEILFGLKGGLAFNVMLHAGTLLATLLVLRAEAGRALRGGLSALVRPARFRETPGGRDALVVILATIPTAAESASSSSRRLKFAKSAVPPTLMATRAASLEQMLVRPHTSETPTFVFCAFPRRSAEWRRSTCAISWPMTPASSDADDACSMSPRFT